MGFEIKTDLEEPRRPVKPPINYMSTSVRLRMLTLFSLLVLVLIMMKEARKPERWEWMGFDKQAQQNAVETERLENQPGQEDGLTASDGKSKPFDRITPLYDLIERGKSNGIPTASEQFWKESFGPLGTNGQRALFRFLRAVCDRTPIEEQQSASFTKLVDSIRLKRDQYHRRLAEQISFLSDDSQRKSPLTEELKKSQDDWEEKILPAWELTLRGEDITLSQQKANVVLIDALHDLALAQVEDATALNRAEEGSAWLLSWDRALKLRPGTATEVTHIQLVSQPRVYRGQPVFITGWIRSANRIEVKKNELGIDHYYVLWVRPADTNVAPYCVYTIQLPEGFAEIGSEFVEMNEHIAIEGVFFKIRSYTAANDQVVTCPLLLAKSFEWNPAGEAVQVDGWFPPRWAVWCFFLTMPVIAAAIAWFAYLGTASPRFIPGQKTQRKISNNLGQLKNNPEIQTDLERVKALYDSEFDAENEDVESGGQGTPDE